MKWGCLTGLMLSVLALTAQPYGNDWIDYNQPHYRIPLTEAGMYRIDYNTLNTYIPNLSSINGENLVMFYMGEEVPLYVTSSGTLGPADYVEFYAEIANERADSLLFPDPSHQINPYYSLFCDTAVYFLSYNALNSNRRITRIINNLSGVPAKEDYFWHTERKFFTDYYNLGQSYVQVQENFYLSEYDNYEGYSSLLQVNNFSDLIDLDGIYTAGPSNYELKYRLLNRFSQAILGININNNQAYSGSHTSHEMVNLQLSRPVSELTQSTSVNGVVNGSVYKGFVEIRYPRSFDFTGLNGFRFEVEGDAPNRSYLEIQNFDDQGTKPILYDLTNGYRIESTQNPGASPVRFALPASSADMDLYIRSASNLRSVTQLEPIVFQDLSNTANQAEFVMISHRKLWDDGNGNNYVEEYRRYKDEILSPLNANSYSTVNIDIDQLYDQFAYGIRKHPLSIRNFAGYALDNWAEQPAFIFLVGKGIELKSSEIPGLSNLGSMRNGALNATNLIPTWGYPASDNLFTAVHNSMTPRIPVGRLPAENAQEVKAYLEKVRVFEQQQNRTGDPYQTLSEKDWMKHIFHFGGGKTAREQDIFKAYLESYADISKEEKWGTTARAFHKESSNPIADITSDFLKARVDSGVSLITFFGHSSPGSFDVNFDEPENYTNYGRYPLILSNGCYSGNIFLESKGISERFVMQEDKGAIAFLSTNGLALSNVLHNFSTHFYEALSDDRYNKPFGSILQQTIQDVENCCFSSITNRFTCNEMTFNGDPSLKFNQFEQPDFVIEPQMVFLEPGIVSTGLDSFELNVVVTNIGMAIEDSFSVYVSRLLPSQEVENYAMRIKAPYYQDTVVFSLPTVVGGASVAGLNYFNIRIDNDDEITNELSETNNNLLNNEVAVNFISDDVLPVFPYDFAILPGNSTVLKASIADLFAPEKTYEFQLDTTELFNSPLLQTTQINQIGGVLKWPVTFPALDSTVWYWRVSKQPENGTSPRWNGSSFIYINGEFPGWNQSHNYQYNYNDYGNVVHNGGEFTFVDDIKEIIVKAGIANTAGGPLREDEVGFTINQVIAHKWRSAKCGGLGGIVLATFDSKTGLPKQTARLPGTDFGPFGNYHCDESFVPLYTDGHDFLPYGTNAFTGNLWEDDIMNYVNSQDPGDFLLMYTFNNPSWNNWSNTLRDFFVAQGASLVDSLVNDPAFNTPYIFFTEIGNPAYPTVEQVGSGNFNQGVAVANILLDGNWNQGHVISPPIGPSTDWQSLHWDFETADGLSTDNQQLDVYGIDGLGNENLLLSLSDTRDTLIDFIDPLVYPRIRLRLETSDDTNRTPTQLNYWRVLFDDVPEAALNPAAYLKLSGDTLLQGEPFTVQIAVENISELDMDSMLVAFAATDVNRNTDTSATRYAPIAAGDTIIASYSASTIASDNNGINYLIIEANPDDDQAEKYHFNNIGVIEYRVQQDRINPLLDVTFDGVRILNGDIVSPVPHIVATLTDENPFLALNDTSLVDVSISYPNGDLVRMDYANSNLTFYPADVGGGAKNQARIELSPEFGQDGIYELIIQDRDVSGNSSSLNSYRVQFEVITSSGITNVLNYPNPFTTSTRFVFTLTGSQLPSYFKIQISDVKGRVVREIFQDELGPIRIGRNITEFAWDGTDRFGDPLGNGVYFYRVVTSKTDGEFEHIGNQAVDRYFKHRLGKMVLIR